MIVLDRFEGDWAVLEMGEGTQKIPREVLPAQAREGDLLRQTSHGWEVDAEATARRRETLARLRQRLISPGEKDT